MEPISDTLHNRKRLLNYLPHIVVFLSSMGVMIIELVASRIIAKYFGNSLFTWTGVIGVVLAGISAGNWLGGRMADRYEPERIMVPQLFIASILVFGILLLDLVIGWFMGSSGGSGISLGLILKSLAVITILFFLPSAALGTISPVMARYALAQSEHVGSTVGSIYALSSIGSIAGTFLSGFVLIPLFGVRLIVFIVALVLVLLGIGVSIVVKAKRIPLQTAILSVWAGMIVLGLLLWGSMPAEARGKSPQETSDGVLYSTDSHYSHIEVKNTEGGTKRILVMDGLIHNMHDLKNPNNLLYEYERIFDALTRAFQQDYLKKETFHTLTLGGGALTFPSYLSRTYPLATHEVVEIDPQVVDVAFRYFEVPKTKNLSIHTLDARLFIQGAQTQDRIWDIVYLDAFNSFSIPYHLTTREFTSTAAELVAENGMLLANAIDIPKYGGFLGAYYKTLSSVFPYVTVYGSPEVSQDRRSTFVLAASRSPLPYEELFAPDGTVRARRMDPAILEEILARNKSRPLTDDYTPVENLMVPVFLDMVR
jgi:spermidine synthase